MHEDCDVHVDLLPTYIEKPVVLPRRNKQHVEHLKIHRPHSVIGGF